MENFFEHRKASKPDDQERFVVPEPKPVEFDLDGEKITLKSYNIGSTPEGGVISPGLMNTGELSKVKDFYRGRKESIKKELLYSFLHNDGNKAFGDYTGPEGQDEFQDSDLIITQENFSPPEWAKELWEFAALKNKKKFTTDSSLACIRDFSLRNGKPVFTLGSGLYSESFNSNGAEGTTIGISQNDRTKLSKLLSQDEIEKLESMSEKIQRTYGRDKNIREIIFSKCGRLPEFKEHVFNNNIGVVGMVMTEKDNHFVFSRRGKNVSIHQGIDSTSSGAAEFDQDILSRFGLQHFLGNELKREIGEELGLKSGSLLLGAMRKKIRLELGIEEDEYELIPVGFVRELIRGGKPECMFIIKFKGSVEDVVKRIIENKHADKKEIEGFVYAQPVEETGRLIENNGADKILQHRAVAHLTLIKEYLKKNSL